jgi:cobalt/nickel transport system permease protein
VVEIVSRLDVRVRLLFLTGLILCVGLTPTTRTASLIGYSVLVVSVVLAGRVSLRWLAWRLLPFLVLLPFGCIGVLFGADPASLLTLWLRAVLIALCALAYTWTTPFAETVAAMAWFRGPGVMVAIAALACRFLSVLGAEATSMARAYAARRPPPGVARAVVVGARLSGSLALRAYLRSERIADAMVARGYDGTFRVLPLPPMSLSGLLAALLSLIVLVAVWFLG